MGKRFNNWVLCGIFALATGVCSQAAFATPTEDNKGAPSLQSLKQSVISLMQEASHRSLSEESGILSIGDLDVHVMNTGILQIAGFKFYDPCILKYKSRVVVVGELDSERSLVKVSRVEENAPELNACPVKAWVLVDTQLLAQWEEFHKHTQRISSLANDEKIKQKSKEGASTLFKSYWVQQTTQKNYGALCYLASGMKVFALSREAYLVVSESETTDGSVSSSSGQNSARCAVGDVVLYTGSSRLF